MIAMTTRSSIRVKPCFERIGIIIARTLRLAVGFRNQVQTTGPDAPAFAQCARDYSILVSIADIASLLEVAEAPSAGGAQPGERSRLRVLEVALAVQEVTRGDRDDNSELCCSRLPGVFLTCYRRCLQLGFVIPNAFLSRP